MCLTRTFKLKLRNHFLFIARCLCLLSSPIDVPPSRLRCSRDFSRCLRMCSSCGSLAVLLEKEDSNVYCNLSKGVNDSDSSTRLLIQSYKHPNCSDFENDSGKFVPISLSHYVGTSSFRRPFGQRYLNSMRIPKSSQNIHPTCH